jgi:hypothetical protein
MICWRRGGALLAQWPKYYATQYYAATRDLSDPEVMDAAWR